MAKITPLVERDQLMAAVEGELRSRVRAGLKKPLMEQAETIVDGIVDEAMTGLKSTIELWFDRARGDTNLNIVIERTIKSEGADSQ